jgi:site-specific DNA recombinase
MKDAKAQDHSIPAVVYAAKSTADPRGSIDAQTTDCEAMAAREGWAVAGAYSDEAASAYHGNRGDGLVQAREHAARLAAEHGEAMLLVQHTDRLARGDGVAAQHLVEVLLWARNADVRLRSVQDDSTGENLLMAAMMGERNHEDSKRKAAATAAGKRRAAERGEWCGAAPDGYFIERTADGTTIVRRVVVHPERWEVYRLLWDMAIDGATVNRIVRELTARGYRTAPRRARPRLFDAVRVGKVIVNPFYAGLMVSQGEIIGAGNWPAYVEPDDWHRITRERSERARYRPQPVGRPRGGLLARLARCECGAAAVQQWAGLRKDGTRKRNYVCTTHMHRRDGCSARPYDAEQIEQMVLGGLSELLGNASAWADALLGGREAERTRLTAVVEEAGREMKECERAIEQLSDKYDAAVIAGDEAEIALAKRAWVRRCQIAERASLRQQAATDALAAQVEQPEADADLALAQLWQSLSGGLKAAAGDVKAMNAALQETFDAFELHRDASELRIQPVLSEVAAVQILRTPGHVPYPTRVTARYPSMSLSVASEPEDAASPHGLALANLVEQDDWVSLEISGPPTLTTEPSGQPGKQRPSHLPHNTRPGSSPGTAGGSSRRSRRGGSARPARSRS